MKFQYFVRRPSGTYDATSFGVSGIGMYVYEKVVTFQTRLGVNVERDSFAVDVSFDRMYGFLRRRRRRRILDGVAATRIRKLRHSGAASLKPSGQKCVL